MRKKVLAEKSVKQGLNQLQFDELLCRNDTERVRAVTITAQAVHELAVGPSRQKRPGRMTGSFLFHLCCDAERVVLRAANP